MLCKLVTVLRSARTRLPSCQASARVARRPYPYPYTRALNVARILLKTADKHVAWGADPGMDPGRAAVAVGGTDERQTEYKYLRTRRELATAPAWVLS